MLGKPVSDLGEAIRRTRKARGLTLKELADRINSSQSYISQVERDKILPSLSALRQLADSLGVSAGSLLDMSKTEEGARADRISIVRKNDRLVVTYPGSPMKNELLLPSYDPNYSITWVTCPPHCSVKPKGPFAARGLHHCVVVSGRITFRTADEDLDLRRGDSILYDPAIEHTWVNRYGVKAEFVQHTGPER